MQASDANKRKCKYMSARGRERDGKRERGFGLAAQR